MGSAATEQQKKEGDNRQGERDPAKSSVVALASKQGAGLGVGAVGRLETHQTQGW